MQIYIEAFAITSSTVPHKPSIAVDKGTVSVNSSV